ncbi:SAGA-associated factor [Lachnellula subtilissima]|uniref:SAGA-associated factor n=1 Tax=Lachnellula subtilissima TaxID=602034 RepID=A0A8H8RA11_9HELO|nr:SAGA-associated factor [Lachnellula subtilissima]
MAEDTNTDSFLLKRLQFTDNQLAEEKFVTEACNLEILPGRGRPTRMSSQRRAPRSGARGGAQENGEEQQLWHDCVSVLAELQQKEKDAEDLKQQIFAEESRLSEAKRNGREPSVAEYYTLECMYRDEIKIAKDQEALIGVDDTSGLKQNVGLLAAMVKHNEEKVESSLPRGSASRDSRDSQSRSGMDMDGTSDSPGPPSAADRQARKLGNGRTSSQPPRNLDVIIRSEAPSEPSERSSNKPKIVYAVGDEVAFKRKSGDDLDWIQGIVTRVIGEGKSRRYEVRDPYPDDKAAELNNNYKSSASQMVPIPSVGAKFEDYEVGKRVLALYPSTSTFYRADVKRMLEGGTKVEVLFEEEQEGKEVERRMVLNHTGQ